MSATRSRQRRAARAVDFARLLPAIIWAVVILVPLVFLVFISLRTSLAYGVAPLAFPESFDISNYLAAWNQGAIPIAFVNTLIITAASVVGVVVLASLAAYGIVRWRGRGGGGFYVYFVLGLIVPFQLGLPLLFKIFAGAGLTDSLPGVIIVQVGAGLPLAVFLYTGFLRSVPLELEEAARIDGAGDVRTFVSIVFPLLRPVTATVVILTAISVWNDLIVSLFFLSTPGNQTLPLATIGFRSLISNNQPVIFACAVITVLPIIVLFIVLQRFFISGLTQGALRG
ncbi:MAG: sugar transporter permease [Microbacteriaceae bacterium]|jgi:raffinose/stachyose/melibiose transport system permease protein|nr:sugar transporter permease [Microbacteriaceae bacterium]